MNEERPGVFGIVERSDYSIAALTEWGSLGSCAPMSTPTFT